MCPLGLLLLFFLKSFILLPNASVVNVLMIRHLLDNGMLMIFVEYNLCLLPTLIWCSGRGFAQD